MSLLSPYYVFRPRQILRRVRVWLNRHSFSNGPADSTIAMPWGARLEFPLDNEIGDSLRTTGVYDLALSELLYRLIERDDLCVDVGANIGYVTSLMIAQGKAVFAFEPHPRLHEMLIRNTPAARCFRMAVSSIAGDAMLYEPDTFASNQGLSSLEREGRETGWRHQVQTETLDHLFPKEEIGVLKVDVEGHESEVFKGAESLLRSHRVRDVVFEEFDAYPAESHRILEAHGYTIMRVDMKFFGPVIHAAAPGLQEPKGAPINYLATIDPSRARERMRRFGWQCLRDVRGADQ